MLIKKSPHFLAVLLVASFYLEAFPTLVLSEDRYVPSKEQEQAADSFIRSQEIVKSQQFISLNRMEYREARIYAYGDLTGDNISDLVIQYTMEERLLWDLYLAILEEPSYKKSWHMRVGGKGWRSVHLKSVGSEGIVMNTKNYGPGDGLCCPSVPGHSNFALIEGSIVETDNRIECPNTGSNN